MTNTPDQNENKTIHVSTKSKDAGPNSTSSVTDNPSTQSDYPPYQSNVKTKPIWMWVLPLVLLTLAIGSLAGWWWGQKQLKEAQLESGKSVAPQIATATGVTEVEKTVNQKPVLTVETVTPSNSNIANDLTAEGTISPETTSTVNGKVSGVAIDEVRVKEGDQVKKGQVLAVFDTDAMNQQLVQAQAELAEAETRFELAKKDANRVLPLLEINAISQQEADRYVATANQAAASVAASRARLNNQNLNLQNAQVKAPVSGTISNKTANVGSVPGPEPLFTIIEDNKLEWQALVDPNKVGEINVGTPVEVSLPNNKSVMGKVTRISPTAEKGSRQISIFASLAKHPNARAGMYQRGTFKLGDQPKVTIPVSAIVTEDGYDYVMQVKAVKDKDRNTIYRINRVKVKLGERQGDRVVLQEPLKGKARIVRQGGSFLSDGDIVRIADTKPAS